MFLRKHICSRSCTSYICLSALIMYKRSASPTVQSDQLVKLVESLKPEASNILPNVLPKRTKVRVLQRYVLCFTPRVEATISLNGVEPEIRFTSSHSQITITGEEFLKLSDSRDEWPEHGVVLGETRLEPSSDGIPLVRYLTDHSNNFLPLALFELESSAVERLKGKLDAMANHIRRLQENVGAIELMFNCIVKVIEKEHGRASLFDARPEEYGQLSRIVETHVPATYIVLMFNVQQAGCQLNPYSLLSCTLAQKHYIHDLLNTNFN